jgi:hypothetical protein
VLCQPGNLDDCVASFLDLDLIFVVQKKTAKHGGNFVVHQEMCCWILIVCTLLLPFWFWFCIAAVFLSSVALERGPLSGGPVPRKQSATETWSVCRPSYHAKGFMCWRQKVVCVCGLPTSVPGNIWSGHRVVPASKKADGCSFTYFRVGCKLA